jgi:hypothetical protein
MTARLADLAAALEAGRMVPYLGPGVLALADDPCPIPRSPQEIVRALIMKAPVPGRLRGDLSASAQYIETYQHRSVLDRILADAFRRQPPPTVLHRWLAGLPRLPMIVDLWYDGLMAAALAGRSDWAQALGLSHPQTVGSWTAWFTADGAPVPEVEGAGCATLLYKPMGALAPVGHGLVSDSDFVEFLTEIDIQTPIPDTVQTRRAEAGFVFLGCRFDGELGRTFARQITKRCGGPLVAVLPEEPTRNEARFLETLNIERLAVPLSEAVAALTSAG